MKNLTALPGARIVDMLQCLIDEAPARIEMNGVVVEVQKGTTLETAIERFEDTFRARWNKPNFKLSR
jgi:hypothetical protein